MTDENLVGFQVRTDCGVASRGCKGFFVELASRNYSRGIQGVGGSQIPQRNLLLGLMKASEGRGGNGWGRRAGGKAGKAQKYRNSIRKDFRGLSKKREQFPH